MSETRIKKKNYRFSLIILTIIYCVFVLVYEKYNALQGEKRIAEHAQIIADDLWNFNGQGISEYLELAASSGNYESLAVVSHNGEVFREIKSAVVSPAISLGIRLHLIPKVVSISYIEYEQKYIGWLEGVWIPQTLSTHFTVFCFLTIIFLAILLYQRTINEKILLEQRVQERTQDLSQSFQKLNKEIDERKAVEKTLRQYEYIISSTDDMMSFVDSNYVYQAVNTAYLTAHNKKIDEIVGRTVEMLMGKEVFLAIKKQLDLALSGEAVKFQDWFDYPGTGRRFKDINYKPFRNTDGEVEGVVVTVHDLTHRKRAEEALLQSESKFRDLVENINDVIFSLDGKGVITYVSPLFFQWTGFEESEVIGKKLNGFIYSNDQKGSDLFPGRPEELSKVREFQILIKSGDFVWVQMSCRPTEKGDSNGGLRGVLTNISEQKDLEAQLFQAQKMEAVGTLAGGIAHDFNNLLAGVQGYVSLLQTEFKESDSSAKYLAYIESFVQSGVALTQQLLGFARGGKYEVRPTNLNDLLIKSSEIFGRTRKNINIVKELEEELWVVEVDRQQIEQVFLNLYLNAWQAMVDGGDLVLATENYIHLENQAAEIPITPGQYVKISVKDCGTGMDQQTMQRIFDPFFTTKELGRGTGLGLASSYGIIKNHSGFISVYSEQGKGTVFTIFLPASHKNAVEESSPEEVGIKRGHEKLLLVDDEEMILEVTGKMLKSLGYEVLTASNGGDALQLLAEENDNLDLLILDMVMPGMSGEELFEKARNISPSIRILLSSGYSLDGKAQAILEKGCNAFIQKPFSLTEISLKIRTVLDEAMAEDS
jgi:PAS domain S-box-containing protein